MGSTWQKRVRAAWAPSARDADTYSISRVTRTDARTMRAVQNVLQKIDTNKIHVPKLVQFFRRYTDGHAVHFEGFSDTGQVVRCFETNEYELHRLYLICAATNPASVDMVCVPLREWFSRPV